MQFLFWPKRFKIRNIYPYQEKITTACWENGLDYKNYFPVFVDIVINEDWETGFEAFTVIENMENYPDTGNYRHIRKKSGRH
jgi:hypothetical protein